MDGMLDDLRQGVRSLRKNPWTTCIALVTLAVGIGSSTLLFDVMRQWVMNAVSFPEPDRLAVLWEKDAKKGWTGTVSPANYLDWRERSRSFAQLSAWRAPSFNLSGEERPERVEGASVSSDFFAALGVRPAIGREFRRDEERDGAGNVVILSYGLWQGRFAGDRQILGRAIKIDGIARTVVGVMPDDFHFPLMGRANLWIPITFTDRDRADRSTGSCRVLGRLQSGSSLAQAQSELETIAAGIERQYPATNTNSGVLIESLAQEMGKHVGNQALYTGFCTGIAILLIGCANVAGILLARALGRRKEMAVRLAMGAGRSRLIRQLLTENLIMFLPAAALGVLLAHLGGNWITGAIPYENRGYLPNYGRISPDAWTLVYTTIVAILSGVVCGLSPALEASKVRLSETLKDAAGALTASGGGQRMRKALVVGEVMLAMVCIVPAGLVSKSFLRRLAVDPGFRAQGILTAMMQVPATQYPDPARAGDFYGRLLNRVRLLPGVESAAISRFIPFGHRSSSVEYRVEGKPEPLPGEVPGTEIISAMPEYAATLGLRLVRGRFITGQDDAATQPVIVINETMAARSFPKQDPIGQKMRLGPIASEPSRTIVGVVGDVKLFSRSDRPERQSYIPFAQAPSRDVAIVLRTSGPPASLEAPLRAAVAELDPDLPLSGIKPMQQRIDDEDSPFRIFAQFSSFNGLLATFLAAIGIYGVMAYIVAGRTREFGIRMALGARPRDVLKLVAGYGVRLTLMGVFAGAAAAYAVSRLLAGFLFGIDAIEPLIYLLSIAALATGVALASYVPSRRAMRVDPSVALRYE
jgi:putative ABC transport system permease protein